MKFIKDHSAFLIIFLTTAILRFLPLSEYQFTFDELSGLDRTQFSSFSELIERGVKIDAHPALIQLIIYYLVKIFGFTTWIIKLPFLLFSLAALVYAYAFSLRNFSKQVALFSTSLLGFSLIFVFYAPIARMYIAGVFFSLALLYYFFEIVFQKKRNMSNYILFGLFALLSALNQHMNALFAFTVCVSGLFFLTKTEVKFYLITCLLVVMAYLPHLPITLYQLSVPGIGRENGGWLETADFSAIYDFLKILFGTGRAYLFVVFLIVLSLALQKKVRFSKQQILMLILFFVNYLIIYFYSIFKSPIFQNSNMLFASTSLIVGLFSFIEFKNQKLFYFLLVGFSAILIYKSYIKKDYLYQSVKTVYEYQFERTNYYKKVYGDKNVYPIFCDADTLMKKIYFEKYQTHFDCTISADSVISNMENVIYQNSSFENVNQVSSLRLFGEMLKNLKSDYVAISSSMPLQQAIVKEHYPFLIENTQTQGINFKLYSKRVEDEEKVVADDKVLFYSDIISPNNFTYSKSKGDVLKDNKMNLILDTLNEYPFEAKADLNSFIRKEGEVVLVSALLKVNSSNNQTEVCISVNDKENNSNYGYSAKGVSDFVLRKDSAVNIYSEYFNGTKYASIKDKSFVKTYLWNKSKQTSELKNFTIQVIDYWPMKWHYWD